MHLRSALFASLVLTGSAPSVFAALNAPTNVTAHTAGPATIVLSWDDNETSEENYIVQRDDSGWTTIATLPANTTFYYDRGLALGSTHNYRVQASSSGDVSAFVESGSASTLGYKPNIIFFLADDMGYKDIVALRNEGIDGPTIHETPELDDFIQSFAVTFDNAYASGPKCVVARRSIQTGKYDWRPEAIPSNDYYVDEDDQPIGGGLWAGGITVAGSESGAGVIIPLDNETYGEAVNAAGYRTCFIGKYHLGESVGTLSTPFGYAFGDKPGRGPVDQGYDVSIASGHAGAPPASYFALLNQKPGAPAGEYTFELPDIDDTSYMISPVAPAEGDYLTDRMTDKAIGFIDDAINNHSSQPFHMTLAHYAVHTPMEAQSNADAPDGKGYEYFQTKKASMSAEFAAHPAGAALITDSTSKTRMTQDNAVYAAMMKSYDASFGQLWDYLQVTDDLRNPGKKLSETTILVVSSDHGGKSTTTIDNNKVLEDDNTDGVNPAPVLLGTNEYRAAFGNAYSSYPTSNYPFRQGKTWTYEGGLKIPLMVYIPGLTQGGARSDAFVHQADFFASFVDMAGGTQSVNSTDSISFMLPAINPDAAARDESFHFFTNADTGTGNFAMGAYRKGDYKLIYFMVQRKVELYNLAADPYEQNDLSESRPDLAAEMLDALYQQVLDTDFKMPLPGSNSWKQEQELFVANGLIASLPTPPDAAPSNLVVAQLSETAIQLDWQVNASNATHSIIYRSGPDERAANDGNDRYREIGYVPVGQTTYVDTRFTSTVGEKYKYRVESENLGGWHGFEIDASGLFSNKGTPYNSGDGSVNTGNTIHTLVADTALAIDAVADSISTVPGELRYFNPLLNDQGEGALIITAITQPTVGSATIDGQWIRYQAPEDFAGSVTMTYTIEDAAAQTDTATVTFTLPILPASEELREGWEFDDTLGTDLNDLLNSGSWGSLWKFNTNAATDGSGNFVVPGDAGTTTRRLPESGTANALAGDDFYAIPVTTGKYRWEVKFSSWAFDSASNGDSLQLQVDDASSNTIARIDLRVLSAGTDIRFSGFDGNFRSAVYTYVESSPITAAIEFDFDKDTIDYLVNDSVVYSFVFNGANIGRLSYFQSGAWTTAASSLSVDYLKLTELLPAGTLYDAFASAYSWDGILDRAPGEDADLDGQSNFLEFALGTSPSEAGGAAPVVLDATGANPVIRFTPVRDTSVLNYAVEFSGDLDDWTTIPPVAVISAAGVEVEEDLPAGGKGFGRVNVSE